MHQPPPRLLIPLAFVSPEIRSSNNLWLELNKKLYDVLEHYLSASKKQYPLSLPRGISNNRLKAATGLSTDTTSPLGKRLGLVFRDDDQQGAFIEEFNQLMQSHGYGSYTLVGTGSSFQGLSTNPQTYKRLGYMKMFGDGGKVDLDLQLYCGDLLEEALHANVALFPDHYILKEMNGDEYAFLTTFMNYSDDLHVGLDKVAPWIEDFEQQWKKELSFNFVGTGVLFEGIHIALMASNFFRPEQNPGAPYPLSQDANAN